MAKPLKALAVASATPIAGSAALVAASAALAEESRPPEIVKTCFGKTIYPCSNGTCAIGPGDTGVPVGAVLVGTGGVPSHSRRTPTK